MVVLYKLLLYTVRLASELHDLGHHLTKEATERAWEHAVTFGPALEEVALDDLHSYRRLAPVVRCALLLELIQRFALPEGGAGDGTAGERLKSFEALTNGSVPVPRLLRALLDTRSLHGPMKRLCWTLATEGGHLANVRAALPGLKQTKDVRDLDDALLELIERFHA